MASLSRTFVSSGKSIRNRSSDILQIAAGALVWKGIADYDWRVSLIVAGVAIFAVVEIRGRS